jgi:hypothetical protein
MLMVAGFDRYYQASAACVPAHAESSLNPAAPLAASCY